MPAPILGFNRETHSRVLSQRVVHVPGFYWTYGIDAHHSAISYRYAARNENSVLVVPASSMDSKGYQGRSLCLVRTLREPWQSAHAMRARLLSLAGSGPWRERPWRQKLTTLDMFVRMKMDSAS